MKPSALDKPSQRLWTVQGVPDISKAPLITTAANASTNAAILRELISLINKEAAEETILYQMSHIDARVVYFDAA